MAVVSAFGLALSWIFAFVGLAVRGAEAAQSAGFVVIFPLVFASSVFVPVRTMPTWLKMFARNNPISHTANAIRGLTQGGPVWHPLWLSVGWIAAILVVFVPLSVNRYRQVQ